MRIPGRLALKALILALTGAPSVVVHAQATVPYPPPGYGAGLEPEGPALDRELDFDEEDDRRAPVRAATARRSHTVSGQLGLGGRLLRLDSGAAAVRASGVALSGALGFSFDERLAVFTELSAGTALAPDVSDPDGRLRGGAGTALTSLGAGAGLTWRPDARHSISAAVLVTQLRLVDRDTGWLLARSRPGPAVELGVGRDWTMPGDLALGLELRAQALRLGDASGARPWLGFGLLVATRLRIG